LKSQKSTLSQSAYYLEFYKRSNDLFNFEFLPWFRTRSCLWTKFKNE